MAGFVIWVTFVLKLYLLLMTSLKVLKAEQFEAFYTNK